MKKTWIYLILAVTIAIFSNQAAFAQDDNWNDDNGRSNQMGRGRNQMDGRHGNQMGRGRGNQTDGGGGNQRGRRRGNQKDRISTEELIEFLGQYEPTVLKNLEELQNSDQRKYWRKLMMLRRLYGKIIGMMDSNPEMAKLMLNKIKISAKIKELVKKSDDGTEIKTELNKLVTELFNIVLALEEIRINQWEKRMEEFESRSNGNDDSNLDSRRGKPKRDSSGRGGPKRDGSGRDSPRGGGFDKNIEDKKKALANWKTNKATIISQRVEQLISKTGSFPW